MEQKSTESPDSTPNISSDIAAAATASTDDKGTEQEIRRIIQNGNRTQVIQNFRSIYLQRSLNDVHSITK